MDAMERSLEVWRHEPLRRVKADLSATLAPFTTDGCSGGLSAGWEYLAFHLPDLAAKHGDVPPWESCCVEHDRAYHTGGRREATAEESFEARKHADLTLESCVVAVGREREPQLQSEYGLSQQQAADLYAAVAAVMYRAVRLGGVPCSGLPWRWGYGWPQC